MNGGFPISDCGLETDLRPAAPGLRGLVVQTKPNLGRMGHVGKGSPRMWGDCAGKWNARNEPNSPAGPGGTRPQGRGTWAECATSPRCPASGNEPNSGRAGPLGPVDRAKQTQLGGTSAAACRLGPARTGCTNKPSSAPSRGGAPYKQTQFAPAGWAGEAVAGAYCAKQTQFPATPGGTWLGGRGTRGNRAKQTQSPEAGHRGGVRLRRGGEASGAGDPGAIAPNKPNSGSGKRRGKCFMGKGLW
jgi:hypothetical protein